MSKDNEPSIAELYQDVEECCKQLFLQEKPYLERRTILRNHCKDIQLYIPDNDLFRIEHKVRHELRGQSEGDLPDVEIQIPEEKWLWHDLIAEGTLNLVIALQKVGKSSLMGAFLGALTCGLTDYLGKDIHGEKRPLIIVGTDQPASDWAEILVAVGLAKRTGEKGIKWLQPIVRLWHRGNPIHLTEEGIETIYSVAKENPNAVVLLDSFSALLRGTGLDEYKPEGVEPISALCEALAPTGATVILLHHSSKSRDSERASNAARGTNALTADCSQLMQLNWLKPDMKHDQRIAITTQGRNSKPVDLVIEQVERAQWISHGSSAEIKEELRLEKEEAKLNEKQDLVLTFVNGLEKPNPTDALTVSKEFADIYLDKDGKKKNGNIKALATLNQLTKKGLIKKKIFTTADRGNVAIFFPRSWEENEVSTLSYRS